MPRVRVGLVEVEVDIERAGAKVIRQALGPLDGDDLFGAESILDPSFGEVPGVEPIEVEVVEAEAASVFVNEGEARAGGRFRGAQTLGQPLHEGGFAGAQFAEEADKVAGRQTLGEGLTQGAGILG